MSKICEQDDVCLREFVEDDIPLKVRWINDCRNNRYLHYDIPLCATKTLSWFRMKNRKTRLDCVIEFQGHPVGLIGLLQIDRENEKAEFYISMGEVDFKRQGIATKASRALLRYAFQILKLHKIYLNTDAENEVAHKLFEKLGFVQEGFFRDDMVHRGKFIDRIRYALISNSIDVERDVRAM